MRINGAPERDTTMASRRGHGEGSIYQRRDNGVWCTAVDLGWVDGKRKRKYIYGKTRKEVAEKLKIVLRDQQQGMPIATERQTVAQFLERWLEEQVKSKNRPTTCESYSRTVHLHILPALGRIPLAKLTPQEVQALLHRKQEEGHSPRHRQYIRSILRTALAQALKWGLVARNAAALTDAPQVERFETHPLIPQQAQAFLEATRGDRLEALYRIALSLGLRRGEVLGLRWEDVDFDRQTVRITQALPAIKGKLRLAPLKTASSRRILPLSAMLVADLKAHRVQQFEERLKEGTRWQEHGLVFTTSIGTPISPRNLVRSFKAVLTRAGLPDIRFHDLRHSRASLLAAQGVPARVAMDVLGHSNIQTTQNIYTHVFDDAKRQAADALEQILGGHREAG